ncbi:MAG: ISKra4 family transposase [Acidiferrobacterales bacterium]
MHAYTLAPEHPFCFAQEQFNQIVDLLSSPDALVMEHGDIEAMLKVEGFELLRRLMQDHLDLRTVRESKREVIGAEGIVRTQTRATHRQLETLFGTVIVGRLGYGKPGVARLHPLDAELNLSPDLYSHGVRRRVGEEVAKTSFDEVVASLATTTGASVPKRQTEQLAVRAAVDFDAFYARRRMLDATAETPRDPIVVISADGKGVVMRMQDLREATRKAAAARTHKKRTRLSRGEKRHAKRMATVASVYTIAPWPRLPEEIVRELHPVREVSSARPKPVRKRVWASLEQPATHVIGAAFEEAARRDPERTKTWVALVDGNKPQLAAFKAAARRYGIALTIIVDLIHVLEYLWRAAHVFHGPDSEESQVWVSQRLLAILQGRSPHVAAGLRRSATLRGFSADTRVAVDDCADYLHDYRPYLHYDQYLAAGLPIATGVIEGACRHLVKDRMDVTGARWSLAGAEAVLKLRSLHASGDFEEYWRFHQAQERQRNHTTQYIDGQIPIEQPAGLRSERDSHLWLIE